MDAHRDALKLNKEPMRYWADQMKELIKEDRDEGTLEEYQKIFRNKKYPT
jgi:hypothetical protein